MLADAGAEQHTTARCFGLFADQVDLAGEVTGEVRDVLRQAVRPERLRDRDHLLVRCVGTGHVATVGQYVQEDPRRGEPDGSLADRFGGEFGDPPQLGRRWCFADGAFAHDVRADRAVTDEAHHVDRRVEVVECVEVLAVALPRPRQPAEDRLCRDVLDALHHVREHLAIVGPTRCERDAAVAHQRGRDAVVARRGEQRIPADLRVEVAVDVDESRGDRLSGGIDLTDADLVDPSDRRDRDAGDPDVGGDGFAPGAVDDGAVADDDVVGHGNSSGVGGSEGSAVRRRPTGTSRTYALTGPGVAVGCRVRSGDRRWLRRRRGGSLR